MRTALASTVGFGTRLGVDKSDPKNPIPVYQITLIADDGSRHPLVRHVPIDELRRMRDSFTRCIEDVQMLLLIGSAPEAPENDAVDQEIATD